MNKFDLNPFEIKAEINKIFQELHDVKDFAAYNVHYKVLDAQNEKNIIVKLLLREINNTNINLELLKFLLIRYSTKEELSEKLWSIIKSKISSNNAKIFALDLLRNIDTNWTYDECEQYLENPDELITSDTQKILNDAIGNPEVQIDFADFLTSISDDDKITLLKSLQDDYSKDELANMVIPVFLAMYDTEVGKVALDILGNSKSQLAYHALNLALDFVEESMIPAIKKNISILKLAGIREDNSISFYKSLLKGSKPYKFCITYPDGHGNQAIIISRINEYGKAKFVAIVIDDYKGIRDCFGFNEISKFECNTIIDRFFRGQRALEIKPEIMKTIIKNAEKISKHRIPYEYICWKTLLADIDYEKPQVKYEIKELSSKEFEEVLTYDFTDYWFLNDKYSDEFEEFLNEIDKLESSEFDNFIDENLEKVFYPEEYKIWSNRILNCAILKHYANDKKAAQNLYSLYNDKRLIRELFKNILRKSLYEYYFKEDNKQRIQEIEDMWVK